MDKAIRHVQEQQASGSQIFGEIEGALEAADTFLPNFLGFFGQFYEPAKKLFNFLPLIKVVLNATHTVAQATGQEPAVAVATVIKHLTPGEPDAPALSSRPDGSQMG